MRPLIQIIIAVLNDEESVPELPYDSLFFVQVKGDLVCWQQNQKLSLRVARFQTLINQEQRKIIHDGDVIILRTNNGKSGQDYLQIMSNVQYINQDIDIVVSMLRSLITECVRSVYAMECDHFGRYYYVDSEMHLYAVEVPQQSIVN